MQQSTWDIKQKIAQEQQALKALKTSVERWKEINDDVKKDVLNITTTGNEWKIRYESQRLYNRMLLKQIQRMRAECRMLRCGVELSTTAEIKALSTIGDCRKFIRNLKVERCSLSNNLTGCSGSCLHPMKCCTGKFDLRMGRRTKWTEYPFACLRQMYERQLDIEAMGYYRARDALEQLTKDVRYHQDVSIREQEMVDSDILVNLKPLISPRKLKPLAGNIPEKPTAWIEPLKVLNPKSYLDLYHNKHHV